MLYYVWDASIYNSEPRAENYQKQKKFCKRDIDDGDKGVKCEAGIGQGGRRGAGGGLWGGGGGERGGRVRE